MSEEMNAQKTQTEEKPQETNEKKAIEVLQGGIAPKNSVELMTMLTKIYEGKGFPERFDNGAKRLAAYNLAQSLMGIHWQLALNNIAEIQGQLCIYGEFPGTLAERTGQVEEKHTYLIDREYKKICTDNKNLDAEPYASVTKIKRKGREMKEFTYTMDEARKAGQYPAMKWDRNTKTRVPNPDSPWEKFKKVMLMRKSQALAVKFEFPEAFVGVPIAEYDFDDAPDLRDVGPIVENEQKAKNLNGRFTKPPETKVVEAEVGRLDS